LLKFITSLIRWKARTISLSSLFETLALAFELSTEFMSIKLKLYFITSLFKIRFEVDKLIYQLMNVHQLEWIIWVVVENLFEVFLIFKFKKKVNTKPKKQIQNWLKNLKKSISISNNNLIFSILNKYNIYVF
jgi:hypothetical protein